MLNLTAARPCAAARDSVPSPRGREGAAVRRVAAFILGCLAAGAAGTSPARPAEPPPIVWPVPVCDLETIASASPAPATSDSASLGLLPFVTGVVPLSAAAVIGLTEDNAPIIRCAVVDEYSVGLENAAIVAIAGLKFSQPKAVNTAEPGGRYLVRVSTLFGASWVHAPPKLPILPACANLESRGAVLSGFDVPKPVSRVQPQYPPGAEGEGIEGKVSVRLEVFSSGRVTPVCISEATPPGWFEAAAVEAVAAWRFPQPEGPGQRFFYEVRIRFELME